MKAAKAAEIQARRRPKLAEMKAQAEAQVAAAEAPVKAPESKAPAKAKKEFSRDSSEQEEKKFARTKPTKSRKPLQTVVKVSTVWDV